MLTDSLKYHDIQLIAYFKNRAISLLEYYRPAFNYFWVKMQVNYRMRLSLFYTLARKHKKSFLETWKLFGKNVCLYAQSKIGELKLVVRFLTSHEINSYSFSSAGLLNFFIGDVNLKKYLTNFFLFKALYKECCFKNCSRKVIAAHNVKSLHRRLQQIFSNSFLAKCKIKTLNFTAMMLIFG
jgi:hypothetical protein